MKAGLDDASLKRIREVFERFPQVDEVILYGSRAMDNYRPGSDIDLTIKTAEPGIDLLNSLSRQLDDLMLPYLFDLSFLQHISNPELLDHINRVGCLFYKREC
jgi:predicted nucleotidyltransferase